MSKSITSETVKDGIKITTYDDGTQHFETVEQPKEAPLEKVDDRSWWQKLKDWWNNVPVAPYVKVRDLADPFGDRTDSDAGSDGKSAIEAGIRIRF